ncbi:MAG: glycoside hydrolase family 75 protein [Luteolibacter sp.]
MSDPAPAKKPKSSLPTLFGVAFLFALTGLVLLCFTGFPRKVKRGLKEIFSPKPVVVQQDTTNLVREAEDRLRMEMEQDFERRAAELRKQIEEAQKKGAPSDLSSASDPAGSVTDVRKLRSGIPFETTVNVEKGGIASKEREETASYTARYELNLKVPAPAKTLEELEASSPSLSKILPGIAPILAKAEVSPMFYQLYDNKVQRIRRDANTLNELLTKHNLYDCETLMHASAENGRRLFLMQADMDVVSDGSDGDRLPEMPSEIVDSPNYQPFTSYGWPKTGTTQNPMISGLERRIKAGDAELKAAGTTPARKTWLKSRLAELRRSVADLQSRSFLIADYDPFIVVPVNVLASSDPNTPKIGDYCVVIYGDKIYPAIVGDGGPTFKVGEASLRMARELNVKATPYNRPVSDLKVTYLIFPGSREAKNSPPDYEKWHQKCHDLLQEIGGLGEGYQLFQWQDTLPKPAPPAPVPPAVPEPLPAAPVPPVPAPTVPVTPVSR